ncbi:MAG: erythromycin biosynthesis sensory transduction protein eryC1 [Chloroflexota bacterium]
MWVPFVDLRAQHAELRAAIEQAFARALDESDFVGGPTVAAFEEAFARFCGVRAAVGVASGTDALELALRALGVGPGDVVVTVPNTFVATVEAFHHLGAQPRFVDIDPATYTMDPELLRAYLVERCVRDGAGVTRERGTGLRVAAVIPVHLYGLPADMAPILAVAAESDIPVIEDACQAHGAAYRLSDGRWLTAGSMGRAAAFSFYPGKNLGALGEAGAVTTDDAALAERVRLLRDHGQRERYLHLIPDGRNARLDAIQAAVLRLKLERLAEWNERRRRAAAWYAEELAGSGLHLPVEPEGRRHVYHLYVVRVPPREREQVRAALAERGVQTGLHYPIPLHRQPAFAHLEIGEGAYPEAERAAAEVLSLPMYPHLTRAQVAYVADALRRALP